MSAIAFFVALVVVCFVLAGIFWIGFYIVLPLVLLFVLVSAACALIDKFKLNSDLKNISKKQKNDKNQVIDVEFEEIKE